MIIVGQETSAVSAMNNMAIVLGKHPADRPALAGEQFTITYGELRRQIVQARAWLSALGLRSGERCAISLPNVPHMPVLYYAALSMGAVVVPLNPLLSAREVNFHVQDAGATILVVWEGTRATQEREHIELSGEAFQIVGASSKFGTIPAGHEPAHEHAVPEAEVKWSNIVEPVGDDDPAVILYTSGTTGSPKGAVLTHANIFSNARLVVEFFNFTSDDVIFGGLPLFHAFGQTVSLNATMTVGAAVALLPRFTPQAAVGLCRQVGVTTLAAVPSMYSALAQFAQGHDVADLKGTFGYGISGGSPLPASTHQAIHDAFDCVILEGYGLSETSPVVSFNQPNHGVVVGSIGQPLAGINVQIRDEDGKVVPTGEPGQLWVNGPNVMQGYWNNPEATQKAIQDGWFATGDVARQDEDGNFFIVDRIKDMILRNGYSIYPREIEDVVDQHRQVLHVAVVGVPNELVDEEVLTYVVPHEPLNESEKKQLVKEIRALCHDNLAAYKYPRRILVVDEMPLGPTGKILKRELVKSYLAEQN